VRWETYCTGTMNFGTPTHSMNQRRKSPQRNFEPTIVMEESLF
jgi:hypothetical protein